MYDLSEKDFENVLQRIRSFLKIEIPPNDGIPRASFEALCKYKYTHF